MFYLFVSNLFVASAFHSDSEGDGRQDPFTLVRYLLTAASKRT